MGRRRPFGFSKRGISIQSNWDGNIPIRSTASKRIARTSSPASLRLAKWRGWKPSSDCDVCLLKDLAARRSSTGVARGKQSRFETHAVGSVRLAFQNLPSFWVSAVRKLFGSEVKMPGELWTTVGAQTFWTRVTCA